MMRRDGGEREHGSVAADRRAWSSWALAFGLAALVSCGDDGAPAPPAPLVVPEGCNPIAADHDCLLPFPSDFYRTAEDGEVRVRIPGAALPVFEGSPADVIATHRPDGFSVGTPILAVLGAPMDDASFVFWTEDVSRSLAPESPTLLIDAETGEPVPHFSELDPRAADPLRQALVMHPLVRLEAGRRYVVGIHGVTSTDGAVIPGPRGFASLRDDAGRAHPLLEGMSAHYEAEVFPLLAAAGVQRAELQLAWDFTTRTDEDAMGDMLSIIDDVGARYDAAPPEVTVVSVEDDVSEHVARRIELSIEVPLYVSSPDEGATLNGSPPLASRATAVPVTVWIPPSVMNRAPGSPPARLLQFGHGFFGTRYESDDFASAFADAHGFVVVGADWWGMADEDRSFLAGELVTNPANAMAFTDRLHQGMANFLALARAAKSSMVDLPALAIGGAPAYDPAALYYYGISNGHILGLSYFALARGVVDRAAFSVGGANYGMMMFRASPFQVLLALLQSQNPDPLDHQKFAALAQMVLDRIDPVSYAALVDPASERFLLQMGIGDASVPNLGSYFAARIYGAKLLEGAQKPFPSWLETTAAPADSAALTAFDFGIEPVVEAVATPANDVHESVRRLAASQEQVSRFFEPDGVIEATCDGVCDPE